MSYQYIDRQNRTGAQHGVTEQKQNSCFLQQELLLIWSPYVKNIHPLLKVSLCSHYQHTVYRPQTLIQDTEENMHEEGTYQQTWLKLAQDFDRHEIEQVRGETKEIISVPFMGSFGEGEREEERERRDHHCAVFQERSISSAEYLQTYSELKLIYHLISQYN